MEVSRIQTIVMGCSDLNGSYRFMGKIVGLPEVYNNHGRVAYQVGGTRLLLRPLNPGEQVEPAMIYLEVPDVEQAATALTEAGFELYQSVRSQPWGEIDCGVRDPSGHYIFFTQSTPQSWVGTS